jgi:Tfp pilus assembly protein PilN
VLYRNRIAPRFVEGTAVVLTTNLSTRPFYNERALHWALALAFAAIVGLTVFNVTRVLSLSARQATLSAEVERREVRVQALTAQAAKVRGSIDQNALAHVIAAAKEANAIIEQRTFSWTELLNHLESTLPTGVMLTSVRPRAQKDQFTITLTVRGRKVEQIDEFIEKLEATGAFSDVLTSEESVNDEEQIEARLQGRYRPAGRAQREPGEPAAGGPGAADPAAIAPAPAGKRTATSATDRRLPGARGVS